MKSPPLASAAISPRAKNSPEKQPDKNSEINPSTKSAEVFQTTRPFHSVPNQLSSRMLAGIPSDEASTPNINCEPGFIPVTNICSPQMQNPKMPTPHSASTTARSFHTGRRANMASRCVTIPKHGSMATYTYACAKNQNSRCQLTPAIAPTLPAVLPADPARKKSVPSKPSASTSAQAASKILKIRMLKMALMNHAHTVTGKRGSVMPFARRSIAVTLKLMATSRDARQNIATLATHNLTPCPGAKKNDAVIPATAATVNHNAAKFSFGNAVSRAPICSGSR